MSYTSNDTPSPFTKGDFIAECYEHPDGTRSIVIYHKGMRVSEPKKARIYDPYAAFRFAAWVVKASEWLNAKVNVGKVGKGTKKQKKHTSISNPKPPKTDCPPVTLP